MRRTPSACETPLETLFACGMFDEAQGCAVCASDEHATAQCPHGQALTLELDEGTFTGADILRFLDKQGDSP